MERFTTRVIAAAVTLLLFCGTAHAATIRELLDEQQRIRDAVAVLRVEGVELAAAQGDRQRVPGVREL